MCEHKYVSRVDSLERGVTHSRWYCDKCRLEFKPVWPEESDVSMEDA